MIAGSNAPSGGRVVVAGQDIQRVRYRQRYRLAIHYHQSYQVRRFRKTTPAFLLERSQSPYPLVHLFDEPQFNTQDGYIGFMLDFFRRLRDEGRLVLVCLHPTAAFQLDILRETCERFLFVSGGKVAPHPTFSNLVAQPEVRAGKFRFSRCEVSRGARQRLWIAGTRVRKLSRFVEKPC